MQQTTGEDWNAMAKMYTSLATGVARLPIASLLKHADELLPFSQATAILDNGCGPGPIVSKIIEGFGDVIPPHATITAADFSEGMINAVREKQAEHKGEPLWDKLTTQVLDATDMSAIPNRTLSHVTAGWVYFMTPDPFKCLTESHRILKDGGILSLSSWQGNDWIDIMNAGLKSKAGVEEFMGNIPAEWKTAQGLSGELRKAGFKDIGAEEVTVTLEVEDREQMIDFFMNSMPPTKKAMQDFTDDEKSRARELMMEAMMRALPEQPGILHGVSVVAWGRKP